MNVLLDNSATNYLADSDESQENLYAVLERGQRSGKLQVFALPTNVIEIALCKDYSKRYSMATKLNLLVMGQRVVPDFEFVNLEIFLELLERHFPGSVQNRQIYSRLSQRSVLPFLAALGQMAAIKEYPLGAFQEIARAKLATTLAQLQFLDAPDAFIKALVRQARGETPDPAVRSRLEKIDSLSVPELEGEVARLKGKVVRVRNITTLQKHRDKIVQQYTAALLVQSIRACFEYIEDFFLLFNFSKIIDGWDTLCPLAPSLDKFMSLPPAVREGVSLKADLHAALELIALVCVRYSEGLMPHYTHSVHAFFREFERTLREPETVSEGLTLDMNYLGSLPKTDIFVTFDQFQAMAAQEYANNLRSTGGPKTLTICRNVGEVEAAMG